MPISRSDRDPTQRPLARVNAVTIALWVFVAVEALAIGFALTLYFLRAPIS